NVATIVPPILSEGFVNVVRPFQIWYTGHTGTREDSGNSKVEFTYEDRGDPQLHIRQGGLPFVADERLSHITTFVNTHEVKDYRLHYAGQSLSQIDKIFECTGRSATASCKPPTTFEYEQQAVYKEQADILKFDASSAAQLDANGDGVPDYL